MSYQGSGRYTHYKGGEYEAIGLALQEDTVTKLNPDGTAAQVGLGRDEVTFVIYRPLTPGSMLEERQEDLWARELSDFNASVRPGGDGSEWQDRFVKTDDSVQEGVMVNGIWLRKIGDQVQVLAEVDNDGGWRLVIEEHQEGNYSHIVEPAGIRNAESAR